MACFSPTAVSSWTSTRWFRQAGGILHARLAHGCLALTIRRKKQHAGHYAVAWDGYVEQYLAKAANEPAKSWPGDEWGDPAQWDVVFEALFVPAGVAEWRRAVEIGPGSGKYTLKVLGAGPVTVRAYDVSAAYLQVCEQRCRSEIESGRLSLHLLGTQPEEMYEELQDAAWRRTVDGFFSIDAMVHVDLQDLVTYLLTAAATLVPGGTLVLSLADATTSGGFDKLLDDIRFFHATQGHPSHKFEWLSPELVRTVLERLGFELYTLSYLNRRDLYVVAHLARPEQADEHVHRLHP